MWEVRLHKSINAAQTDISTGLLCYERCNPHVKVYCWSYSNGWLPPAKLSKLDDTNLNQDLRSCCELT